MEIAEIIRFILCEHTATHFNRRVPHSLILQSTCNHRPHSIRSLILALYPVMHRSFIVLVLLCSIVQAFTPWDWPDDPNDAAKGISHETITRTVFNNMVQLYWPNLVISRSMIDARDTIITANGDVDQDQYHSARHFDAENFDGGQFVLTGTPGDAADTADDDDVNLLHQILWYLDTYSIDDARVALGKAMHTIQDFYAHTNWVEMGNREPHGELGRVDGVLGDIPTTQDTCTTCGDPLPDAEDQDCNDCDHDLIVQRLTSGYYPGEDRRAPPNVAKCRHGGPWDDQGALPGSTDGINKDNLVCYWSTHGPKYHKIAVELATLACQQFIGDIRSIITTDENEDIAEQQMRLLFAVDTLPEPGLVTRQFDPSRQPDFNFAPVLTVSNFGSVIMERRQKLYSYSVPVDGFTETIRFALEGDYVITVSRPDGSVVKSGDHDVDISTLSNITVLTVASPPRGSWEISLNGVGKFSLSVSSQSSIHFSFSFAEIRGRPGHSGWARNPNIVPTPGIDLPVLGNLDGEQFSDVMYQIRNANGDILNDNLPFLLGSGEFGQPSENSFFGFINIPSCDFHVYVTGNDSTGNSFIRHHPTRYEPTTPN